MANGSKIVITAGLQVPETISTIEKELKTVSEKLTADKALQIVGNIDLGKTTQRLQSQLATISKNLQVDIGVGNIQKNIDKAVKIEPIKINVEPDIKTNEIKRQAKSLKEIWGIDFAGESKESIQSLNAQLQEMLTNYDKAMKSGNFNDLMSSWERLSEFVNNYAGGIKNLTPEMEQLNSIMRHTKVLITEDNYKELEHIYETKGNIKSVLDNALGVGKWSYDRSKASYGFDSLVKEINGRLYGDDSIEKISEHIVKGLEQISALRSSDTQSARDWEQYQEEILSKDANAWENYKNAVLDTLYAIRGEANPASSGFIEIVSDNEIQKAEKNNEIYRNAAQIIAEYKEQYMSLSNVKGVTADWTKDSEGNLTGFIINVQKATGEIEKFKYAIDSWGEVNPLNIAGSDKGVNKMQQDIARLQKELANFEASHKAIESGLTQPLSEARNALNDLKNNVGSVETVEKALDNLKTVAANIGSNLKSTGSSFNVFDNAANKAQNFDNTIKTLSMDISTLGASDNKSNLLSQLDLAKQRLEEFKRIENEQGRGLEWSSRYAEISSLIQNITNNLKVAQKEDATFNREFEQELKAEQKLEEAEQKRLQTARELREEQQHNYWQGRFEDTIKGLTAENTELKQMREYYEGVNKAAKEFEQTQGEIKKVINSLNQQSQSRVFANNASNPDVATQQANIAALRAELEKLLTASPEALSSVKARFEQLKPSIDSVTQSTNSLNNALKNDSSTDQFEAKLDALRNRMEYFAKANQEATESLRKMRSGLTFKEEWQNMLAQINNPNLDAEGLRRLAEQFRNFTGEARTAGTVTSHLFDNMGNQLKMMASRWVSLYAIIGKIRTMINYVTQLDTAMTKLKRVTDETAAGYEQFLETAKESARETNTTLVDTVEQAAKWAKSGYDAATSAELAKTSLIYSIVGDIDNDTAVNDLVTALRGFRLEAEDAISVVDKLDALNNKYATDAKSLGEGLRVSASAMAAANNDIDQTLALLTGATEITQNAQETGQAIKTITMRLRGMKGELQELGEDAEGIESISKIQTQILNLTKGRVNIFDANGNFRATYDILEDIAKVYNELSDPDKANLTEIIFGKLRSNQGLAIISAFQSGQIQKALRDSQSAAGTATEEMERYAESIQAHLNQFKEAAQELSADAIDTEFVKDIINDGITLLTLLNNIVKAFKEIKDIIPQSIKDAYSYIRNNSPLNPLHHILELANNVDKLFSKTFDDTDTHIAEVNKMSAGLDSIVQKYIEYNGVGEDSESITAKLSSEIENINEAYSDNSDKIDLVNKGLSENLSLMRQMEKQEVGEWLRKNAEDYEKAIDALKNVDTVDEYGRAPFAYQMNAKGIGRYTKKQYDAFDKLGLDNYVSGQNTGYVYDFALTGTLEEQLDSLTKIRDVYASLQDREQGRLDQFDAEIGKLKEQIDGYNNLIKTYDQYKAKYESMQNVTAQEYNLIEQAINAYNEYQSAVLANDKDSTANALKSLNGIKDIVYSMTDTNSVLRQDFNDLWATFVLGATGAESKIDDIRADFAELSGEAFDKELKNVEDISKAIDSLLNGENLSHEDAWKLLNLDTEGVLSDIQLINGQYKLSTDQLVALMEQQINKQKESIETTKAQAVEELNLLKIQLRRLKVNSPSDVAAYKSQLEKITGDMRDMQNIIDGSDLLLQELNGHLNKTYAITGTIATSLTNAVKQFEAEVEAIDNAIDSLNDRKEVLQDEKSVLQDQLDVLNEQKKTIEDTIANYDKVGEAVNDLVQAQVEGIQSQIDALEEERKAIEDYYEEQLDALKEQNEERDDAIEKEEALANLADAQSKKKRVYSSARGWTYESSKEDILNAQNALAKIATNEQIKALEKERDSKLGEFDDRKKDYESQIKSYQEYAKQYTSVADDIKKAENELLADQILGSEWREKIEQKDEGLLTKYRAQYTSFNEQLTSLTNNEIATLQASIDAKDAEIKKVDDEVKAYNRYKSTVQKSLADAKTALENYKNSMNTTKQDIIDAWEEMEHEGWDRSWKMESYNNKIASSAEDARDIVVAAYRDIENALSMFDRFQDSPTGFGIVNSAGDAELLRKLRNLGYYDNGGTNSYTGLAMLHGTKQKSETIFNANDSKKLYDMIHNTPNLMADMVKKASRSIGFTPVNNTNSNSVNVHIGQIVANNPREFTQGLDRELDSYFRRKLTASYVQ